MKKERGQWRYYQTREEAQQDSLNYLTLFYNSQRLHSYLDYTRPIEYKLAMATLVKAA